MKKRRLNTFFPRLKNGIKRVLGFDGQKAAQEPIEMDIEYEESEEIVDTLDKLLDDIYVFIKDVPMERRRETLKIISPEDTSDELIDFILEAIIEKERENLKIAPPLTKRELRKRKKEEEKEFAKDNFYPSFE